VWESECIHLYFYDLGTNCAARGSVVVKALCYKPEGRGFDTRWGDFFKIYLILPAALGPRVYSASNRNECQKQKNKIMFLGSKVRLVGKADNFSAISEPIVHTIWDP
jgi:hypothetical protein